MADSTNVNNPRPANEISITGQWIGGILLIGFSILGVLLLLGYWPDRLPDASGAYKCQLYSNQWFDVRLLPDTGCDTLKSEALIADTAKKGAAKSVKLTSGTDSSTRDTTAKSAPTKKNAEHPAAPKTAVASETSVDKPCCCNIAGTITYSKLLLLLVCIAGFLGAMIHSASSFSAYIGSKKFTASWKLWYFLNPFIGSGLALTVYFALHAGLLAKANDAGDINIYGTMTLALMTGLFTRVATQKLKEIFDAAFNPKSDLPDKIDNPKT